MGDRPSTSPVIRAMAPTDLDRIVEIDTKVLGKQRSEYWELKLESLDKRSQVSSLVAESDGRVVGFIIGGASRWEFGVPEHIGWIDTIGVDPDHQRKGIAKRLFAEMTDNLKKVGVDTIITFVTRRDWVLLKFFNSMGFQKGDMVNLELDI
ncbi:MAG: GNAT family N-acetyltransferase [Desulfobacterales bacterium]|jgi:ribosomal protein S18 acetylase RimI-like enzyme